MPWPLGSAKIWRAWRFLVLTTLFGPGSELNRLALQKLRHLCPASDLRIASDMEALPNADWVIDAAANPSVLAGMDGQSSSRQVVENNLGGTVNILEYCKTHHAGLILLSTSRVYSIPQLSSLKSRSWMGHIDQWQIRCSRWASRLSGVTEDYSTLAAGIALWQCQTCFGMPRLGIWRGFRLSGLD